ncbi:hypothetical protein GCM10019059_34880 [Camelimonas fluminis]|uniref:Uncharacterized protein n=1 Tax=Camelimonas fluminis TaxID=1576911 RepID=A0ABV7UFR7_9HYPH|nr:hypothetical protein [Camelimonas fluminis]GHE72276.1 hypothetical protein GCM10019059_34880 [Camelimonas fluminis]
MAAKAPRNDAKTKAPADAPVAAPSEATAAAGETSTAEAGSSPAGEAVSQGAVAPAGSGPAAPGPDAGDGPQGAADDAADTAGSGRSQLTGATLFLGDRPGDVSHSERRGGIILPATSEVTFVIGAHPARPICSVAAPNGPRWRAGMQFGPEAVNVSRAELGTDPDATLKSLQADPHLRVGPPIDTE